MAAFLKQLRQTRLQELAGTYLELQHMKHWNAYMNATPETHITCPFFIHTNYNGSTTS